MTGLKNNFLISPHFAHNLNKNKKTRPIRSINNILYMYKACEFKEYFSYLSSSEPKLGSHCVHLFHALGIT